jgi:2-keto-myo-inositol isomerase
MNSIRFALNHMCAPSMPIDDFFAMAKSIDVRSVEVRNDLSGNAILDGTPASAIREAAARHGVTIISINALQRFNEWNDTRAAEAGALIDYAKECGARALVLVPVNDGSGREEGIRQANLVTALQGLKPMLDAAGVIGLVEPLGFAICSLSSKAEAASAIEGVGGQSTFKLVHDTFHHHLAGERTIFPAMTGLVHISGVSDPDVAVEDMRDPHRVLVDENDRLDNLGQIKQLREAGYVGPFSFEPFAPDVHALPQPATALKASMDYLASES